MKIGALRLVLAVRRDGEWRHGLAYRIGPSRFARRIARRLVSPYIDGMSDDYADSLEAQMIVDYVSGGTTLIDACRTLGITRYVVYAQIRASERFAAMMEQARADGYDVIANDCLAIADDTSRDTIGGVKPNKEWMARSRLRVDTRLKLLSKWHPKKYGEKLQVEQKTASVQIPVTDDPVLATAAYERLMRGE